MVRFVMMVGVFFLVGFIVWMLLPAWDGFTNIINVTGDASDLELGLWNMMAVIVAVVIIACVIWRFFGRKSGGDE